MNDKEKVQLLLDSAETMRELQKAYWEERSKGRRMELLAKAKIAEREFDNVLFNLRQLYLFS